MRGKGSTPPSLPTDKLALGKVGPWLVMASTKVSNQYPILRMVQLCHRGSKLISKWQIDPPILGANIVIILYIKIFQNSYHNIYACMYLKCYRLNAFFLDNMLCMYWCCQCFVKICLYFVKICLCFVKICLYLYRYCAYVLW